MTLLYDYQEIKTSFNRHVFEEVQNWRHCQRGVAFLLHDDKTILQEWEILEKLHSEFCTEQGQFISLNIQDFGEATLPGIFYSALEYSQVSRTFRMNLPMILQNNPHTESPFINRAILWQRLCDLIIIDEKRQRPTLLVFENFDSATRKTQQDVVRLIQFHFSHQISRSFLITLHQNQFDRLLPAVRELTETIFEFNN